MYEESFLQNANISRCNFMKALHRSAPLEVAALPPPFHSDHIALMVQPLSPSLLSLTTNVQYELAHSLECYQNCKYILQGRCET